VGDQRQLIVRGVVLGVTRVNSILTSRAALVPATFASAEIQQELWHSPTSRANFDLLGTDACEISAYLFGEESEDPSAATVIELKSGDQSD
jgi:hypothetical protein